MIRRLNQTATSSIALPYLVLLDSVLLFSGGFLRYLRLLPDDGRIPGFSRCWTSAFFVVVVIMFVFVVGGVARRPLRSLLLRSLESGRNVDGDLAMAAAAGAIHRYHLPAAPVLVRMKVIMI